MGRYKKIKKEVQKELAFQKEQEKLHEKHGGIDSDTVIIEKSNMVKFLLNFLRVVFRTFFGIITIFLSTVGILTLLYPETRAAFFGVVNQIIGDLVGLLK